MIEAFAPRFETLNAYSTTGVRPETDFFFWKITERYEDLDLWLRIAARLAAFNAVQNTYLSTDAAHARIEQSGGTWKIGWDDGLLDGWVVGLPAGCMVGRDDG